MNNLVLITVDCLRADHISCLGYSKKITPEIDKIAKKGALFTQAISNGSWTSFSFPSIFTSTFPLMHQITRQQTKGIHFPMHQKVLVWNVVRLTNVTSLAEVLKKKGYSTGGFHSNPYTSTYFNYGKGFDCYKDLGQQVDSKSSVRLGKVNRWKEFFLNKLSELSGKFCWLRAWCRVYLRSRHLTHSPPYAKADLTTEKGFSWLKKNSRGFFLWLHYMDPHSPYQLFKLSANDLLKYFEVSNKIAHNQNSILNEDLQEYARIQKMLYDDEVKYVDRQIGFLLDKLGKIGVTLDNTFIILTADHGELLGEHGGFLHGGKLCDELIHVPLIVCGPGIKPSTIIDEQVSLLDVAPTILDLLKCKAPESFQGISLVPLIKGEETNLRRWVVSEELVNGVKMFSCRTKNWKYILTITKNGKKKEEMYNLKLDPIETRNVIDEREVGEVRKTFRFYLSEHMSIEKKFREKERIKTMIQKIKKH